MLLSYGKLSISWRMLLFVLLVVGAPSCILGQVVCAPLTHNTCAQFVSVGTEIYVPPGYSMALVEQVSTAVFNLVNAAGLTEPCRTLSLTLVCATWLRPCALNGTYPIPLPREPCVGRCNDWWENCSSGQIGGSKPSTLGTGLYFPPGYKVPLNCSAAKEKDIALGKAPFWQNGNLTVKYEGQEYTLECSQPDALVGKAALVCPVPLVEEIRNAKGAHACSMTCPLPELTDDQYANVKDMQGVLGWFSWVATAIMIIALVVPPKARRFPRSLIIMTACAANIAAAAIILPTYAGYDNIWCGGSGQSIPPSVVKVSYSPNGVPSLVYSFGGSPLEYSSSGCTLQGAMLQFGFLSAVFWWVIIAFNMCIELFFGRLLNLDRPKWKWGLFLIYNLIGWGLSFILMVIPAAAGQITFAPAATYCFVTNSDNHAWSLTFWFVPVGISLLLGVSFFFIALVRITILLITIKKIKELLYLYLRLLVFIFNYLILFVFITAYHIKVSAQSTDIIDGYNNYYTCLILQGSGCSLSEDVSNYNLVMLKSFAISSLGLLLMLNFISWDVLLFWYRLGKATVLAIKLHNLEALTVVGNMVLSASARTFGSDPSLTVTTTENLDDDVVVRRDETVSLDTMEGGEDEDDEEEKRKEGDSSSVPEASESSSSEE